MGRALTALALATVVLAGCGGSTPAPAGSPTTTPSGTVTPTASPTDSQTTPSVTIHSLRVYFLRGEKVVSAYRAVPVTGSAVASAAMTALLAGPSTAEMGAGVSTAIPTGTALNGVRITNGVAQVDLSSTYASGGGSLSMTARLMQVVFTLTQFPTVTGVSLALDGVPTTVLGGEGVLIKTPATRSQYDSFLPPIFIDSPAMGQTVTSPLTVTGLANVFEGQFSVQVTDATGSVLARAPGMASMGEFSPFTVTLSFTAPAQGAGTVTGYDNSPKDGTRIDVYDVPVLFGPAG